MNEDGTIEVEAFNSLFNRKLVFVVLNYYRC